MSEAAKGVWAMIAACCLWGVSPIYYDLLDHVPPTEIFAHRTLWSFLFFALVLLGQGRITAIGAALRDGRAALRVVMAACLISFNWLVFIIAIQIDMAIEASLGYFIFPLLTVLLGVVVLREPMNAGQGVAVALAALAVGVLSLGLGVAPWVALLLGASFSLYALIKKGLALGPVVSVTAEVMLFSPVAAAILIWHHAHGGGGDGGGAFGASLLDSVILVASGVMTALPLILLSYATKRAALATIGLVQYLNPSLQFLVATLIFLEPLSRWHMIAFAMIWVALAIYSWSSLRRDRAAG